MPAGTPTGALLAPGFYPDERGSGAEAVPRSLRRRVRAAPGATEAYAFDAAQLAAAAGSGGRAASPRRSRTGRSPASPGAIKFDADHRRADPGVVYTVVEETDGVLAIRTLR